jgi:hypothetical protein
MCNDSQLCAQKRKGRVFDVSTKNVLAYDFADVESV